MSKVRNSGLAFGFLCSLVFLIAGTLGKLHAQIDGVKLGAQAFHEGAGSEHWDLEVSTNVVLTPKPLAFATDPEPEKPMRANHGDTFNALTLRTNSARALSVWHRVKRKIANERAVYKMCDGDGSLCAPRLRKWRNILRSAHALSGPNLLKLVNKQVNSLAPYREDEVQFGTKDYWASPLEFLDAGGDCEDFAILKYVTLVELGVPEENLHLVVGEDNARQRAHAVLSVQVAGQTFVLDSVSDKLLSKSDVSRFSARYSISGNNRWLHVRARKVEAKL